MGFNLANERIQDSYPQLVQISGSTLVNGTGTVIPAITNINSVSSSYAISASYADYAVSASYEIIKEVSSSHADMADTASYAMYAATAGTANSATTSTSASYALTASYAANATIPTLQQVTDEGASTSNDITLTNPNGNQRIIIDGGLGNDSYLQGLPDFATTFEDSKISGFSILEDVYIITGSYGRIDFLSNDFYVVPDRHIYLRPVNNLYIEPTNGSTRVSGSLIITSSTITSVGVDVSYTNSVIPALNRTSRITPQGFQTLDDEGNIKFRIGTSVNPANVSSSYFNTQNYGVGGYNYGLWSGPTDGVVIFDKYPTPGVQLAIASALPNHLSPLVYISPRLVVDGDITSSGFISSSDGFIGNLTGTADTASYIDPTFISASAAAAGFGSGGGTALPFGAETFFNAATYTIDVPGDTNDPAYDIHISQSGVYFISASKVPPYAANGPRINLIYWPELLGSGEVAKVKFFIPGNDTGTGVSYKPAVTCSAGYEWFWNSTTLPASTTTSNLSRNLSYPQHSNGVGVTNMIKGGDGYVYFSSATSPVPSQNYLITGPSISLLT